jgi:hypothetical protein
MIDTREVRVSWKIPGGSPNYMHVTPRETGIEKTTGVTAGNPLRAKRLLSDASRLVHTTALQTIYPRRRIGLSNAPKRTSGSRLPGAGARDRWTGAVLYTLAGSGMAGPEEVRGETALF